MLFIEIKDRVYRYQFEKAVNSIGTAEDNVIRIKDPSLASHHMMISYVDGKFFLRRVEDAPVRLNGERLENYTEELRYGDVISAGELRLRLAEGGKLSDVAVLFSIVPHMAEDVRPWQVFMSRKCEILVGDAPCDLLLPGSMGGGAATIENYGTGCQYIVPPEGGSVSINETACTRRTRIKNGDVIRLKGFTTRIRTLRAEVMENAEGLLWPEVLTRYAVTDEKR
jgi:ribosome-associated protein YbcJ (S4-like RNA binding protein)